MKGRSHRPLPSVPLEDWGDGQWTVDCSCGVTFDDGEEMVSCDECGVWVHTRCSRYVRGEVSFACHKCKVTAKRSRSVIVSAANNFVHDTEETEVAQLLVELPTKTDPPPPAPPVGASYRPPFRLWAHVPMEERVHVQGVPGGDPSLFRGLSSKIFSPELWKCTGYVPKKFNFKYKEFPCWEEEERDKACRGADALFSLSKQIVQASPIRAFEKISSPDRGRKKDRDKILFDTRPFSCVKKERNKLRVVSSHASKVRKEELGEEKEFSGRKRSRGNFDMGLADVKDKAGSITVFNSIKEDIEEGDPQMEELDVLENKNASNREDTPLKTSGKGPNDGMNNSSKTKHLLVFKTSRRRLSDEALKSKLSLETPVKVEKVDQLDGRASCKLDSVAACRIESRNVAKAFTKQEDEAVKEPKCESCVPSLVNGGTIGPLHDSGKMKSSIYTYGNQCDVPDIISSSVLCSPSTSKVELNVKIEATTEDSLDNSFFPRFLSVGEQCDIHEFPQNELKSLDCSSIAREESVTCLSVRPDEEKPQALQKDSQVSQSYKECVNTAGSESKCKDSVESCHVSKFFCINSMKLSGANPSKSVSHVQQMAGIDKDFANSTALYSSQSSVSCTGNLTALCGSNPSVTNTLKSTASAVLHSPSGKAIHATKQTSVKTTTCSTGTIDTMVASTSPEENGMLQQPEKVHSYGAESGGSKSLQAGKISHSSPSKNRSLDSKEVPSAPSCQTSAEIPVTSLGNAEAIISLAQTPVNQPKTTSLGSSQKTDKSIQSNTSPGTKFLSHPLVMQASTSSSAATTLSDEELALLLHQELNSSPRVPRVPRMRQTTNAQFSTPSTTSMLSKRACSGGRDQVSFFRRKHKENASKNSPHHSREAVSESRRIGRHSPDIKQEDSSVFSDGLSKRGKGSKSFDTVTSSKPSLAGTSIESANCLSMSSEENGTRTSLRTSPANADGSGTLAGLTLPGLIDEIMSKRKCSSYDELCDSVRPYWRSLRKPNGERYAYFSHSQAVLDCLRNRTEWAHLIDRGPKTNASKRRKLDAETHAPEIEYKKSGTSHRDDFPKRKRNVRKRRLLQRRLGSAKEATNARSSQGTLSDDDDQAAISHSSNDEAECQVSDDTGPEACSSSSGDSD